MEEPMKKSKLPKTDSIDELAKFWDCHDLTDFEAELEEVTEPVFVRRDAIQVRLPARDAKAVRKLAQAKGVSEEELVRTWIGERIGPRNRHSAKKRAPAGKHGK
jgi:predicted DNA binding CopG/RHH family protein